MQANRLKAGSYICRRSKHHEYTRGGYEPRHARPFLISFEHFMAWEMTAYTPRHRA